MKNKPNAFQKMFIRFYMLPAVTSIWPTIQHPMDRLAFKFTKGRRSVSEILSGVPVIQLTTTGAKTGETRTLPLVSMLDGEKIALVASNFGQMHNPGWYYNLKAHPQCKVQVNGRTADYIARQVEGAEYEKYWNMAVSYYKGYELYKIRAAHRPIPVMVLEPAK